MGKRITNDEVILALRKEGKTSQQIADHFGVSKVAINKRLRKLNPQPDLSHLTRKEESFVVAVASGKNHVDAAQESYDAADRRSAATIGMSLLKKPEIQASIESLMEYNGLSKGYRIRKLKDHVDNADPNVSLKALDMSFKLDSSYPPTKNVNLNAQVQFHPVDLSKYEMHHDEPIEAEFIEK